LENWIAPAIVIVAIVLLVGNFSTLKKNAKTPLRKKGLNDLQETIPRSNKSTHKPPTASTSPAQPSSTKKK